MKCEKCGKEIDSLLVDCFNYDGSDSCYRFPITEYEEDAVTVDVDRNWTGYELSEEEQVDRLSCPHCKQFPFESKEVQIQEIVHIICFKKGSDTE